MPQAPLRAILATLAVAAGAAAQLRPARPESVGLSTAALQRAAGLLESQVRSGGMHAAALLVARNERIVLEKAFGRLSPAAGAPPVTPDSIFLLASITKPVTACAVMLMVERGQIALSDPVERYLPEFHGGERGKVRVRDLLAHTSGLPDMLPENIELRRAHAPLSDFVKHALSTPLLYTPGTSFRYQSMGILLAGEIVERLSGTRLRDFEDREIFGLLGMKSSLLGLGGRQIRDLVACQESANANPVDTERFGANSSYWRDMGHPWGGMHSTVRDLAVLLQTFLNGGSYGGHRLFSPATVRAMTSDQNGAVKSPWGLGWALGRSVVWNAFGDLVSPETFGHAGATGTVAWADPRTQLVCVLLTSRPYSVDDGRLLRLVSNTVAAAVHQ